MKLSTGQKNPYLIYFPKTDQDGYTSMEPEQIRGQFEDHWEAALMDYSGSFADASQRATFFLYDLRKLIYDGNVEHALEWPLFRNERKVWASREEQVKYVTSSRNSKFAFWRPFTKVPEAGSISLWVLPLGK